MRIISSETAHCQRVSEQRRIGFPTITLNRSFQLCGNAGDCLFWFLCLLVRLTRRHNRSVAARRFDEIARMLVKSIKSQVDTNDLSRQTRFRPDHHVSATIHSSDIIGGIILTTCDAFGKEISRAFQIGQRHYGLFNADFSRLTDLSEQIHRLPAFNAVITFKSLREFIFEWIEQTHCGFITSNICDFLIAKCDDAIQTYEVWAPVSFLNIERDFEIGNIELKTISKSLLDVWHTTAARTAKTDKNKVDHLFEKRRRKLQGLAAGVMKIVAEAERARQIALLETEKAIALLRVLSPASRTTELNCNCVMLGSGGIKTSMTMTRANGGAFDSYERMTERRDPRWVLDSRGIDALYELGLNNLSRLLKDQKLSDFRKKVLDCLLLYSKVSIAKELEEKVVYLFAALEGLLLRNPDELIQQNVGERMAFLIGKNLAHRKTIVKNIREVYKLRSQFLHHAQSIQETSALNMLMKNAWFTFIHVVDNLDVFNNTDEFLQSIDDRRLS